MTEPVFTTGKRENLQSKIKRSGFNFFPAYRRTGAGICFIPGDFQEVHVRVGLNWKTRNNAGSVSAEVSRTMYIAESMHYKTQRATG